MKDAAVPAGLPTGENGEEYVLIPPHPSELDAENVPTDDRIRMNAAAERIEANRPVCTEDPANDMERTAPKPPQNAAPQVSAKEGFRIAMCFQSLQLLLLERMGNAAANEHTHTGDPIVFSGGMLAMCTFAVMMSLGQVRETWSIGTASEVSAERSRGGKLGGKSPGRSS